ncbi:hypothetical protein KL905_004397 [Ogataea polymorpha]|nr:hypothetical protein KL905_004397 [Ogataea polymorpha]KAG7932186.1 hypothetical protein KL904_004611 [Ogataea polymorpha]
MSLSSSVDELSKRERAPRRQDRTAHCAHNYAHSGVECAGVQRDAVPIFFAALRRGLGRQCGPVRDGASGGIVCDGAPARGHGGRDQQPKAGADAQTAQPRAAGPVAGVQRWQASAGAWAQAPRQQRADPKTTAANQRATKCAQHKRLASCQHKNTSENSVHQKPDPVAQVPTSADNCESAQPEKEK